MSKKDSYWFKHDSTSGRGLRMRKMAHIYGHWGKGIYWDVIEILRDQSNYCFESDDSSLQMLADLIGCKDDIKFLTWFRDCVKFELFTIQENKFYSEVLCENMAVWETKKANGGTKNKRIVSEIEAKPQAKQKHKIREYNSIEDIPDVYEFLDYCKTIKEFDFKELEYSYKNKYETWVSDGWKDGNGNKIKNWKTKIKNTAPFLKPIKQLNKGSQIPNAIG